MVVDVGELLVKEHVQLVLDLVGQRVVIKEMVVLESLPQSLRHHDFIAYNLDKATN